MKRQLIIGLVLVLLIGVCCGTDFGFDLGTAITRAYVRGEGIVRREPAVVAVDANSNEVLAIGKKAKEMLGRTPESITAVRPLKDGVIADFDITANMLENFLK